MIFKREKILVFIFIVAFFILVAANSSFGQSADTTSPIKFEIAVPADTFMVGDDITVKISAEYPGNIKLTPPSDKFSDQTFNLKKGPVIESKSEGDKKIDTYTFTIVPFETGAIQTPAFEFYWFDTANKSHMVAAPQRQVLVKSLLPADTSGADIKDIVGPKPLPTRWWPYVLVAVILMAIVAAWYFLFKRKLQKMEIPQAPPEPPFDRAIRELALFVEKDLLGKGKIKPFYIELSGILRQYIEGRYDIKAIEATTYELKRMLKHPELPSDRAQEILAFLSRTDLVKFAKFIPPAEFPQSDYEFVRDFVIATKPVELAAEPVKEVAK